MKKDFVFMIGFIGFVVVMTMILGGLLYAFGDMISLDKIMETIRGF